MPGGPDSDHRPVAYRQRVPFCFPTGAAGSALVAGTALACGRTAQTRMSGRCYFFAAASPLAPARLASNGIRSVALTSRIATSHAPCGAAAKETV